MRFIHPTLFMLLMSISPSFAQTANQSIFEVFQQQELLNVTLETDFTNILADKRNEEYQEAIFTYKNVDGDEVQYNIKVKQRGKYRRRVCEMPPLKLNFSKSELVEAGLSSFDKMKLVTYCMDDLSARDQVIREYLAYQLYKELSPYSYRTQLIKITYIDRANSKNKVKHFGFLIESTKELAVRVNGKEVEAYNLEIEQLNSKQEALVSTFQYMIGNADWNTAIMRNVKLIQPNDGSKLIVVPYDFDFSGMVDASYAVPNTNLGLKTVQDRAFLGANTDEQLLDVIHNYLARKQDDLYAIINDCKYLSRSSRYEVIEYLDTFYE
ncbi:MAG: hypothetical protein AAGG68_26900 [Bacteroidota bacterium]